MDDLLVLCATGPAGDAIWDRSAALYAAEHAARTAERLLIRAPADSLFAKAPDRVYIAQCLRELFPARGFDALQIAIAVSPEEPDGLPRLRALLDAVSGISQVPAQIHLIVLSPETCTRTESGSRRLQELFACVEGRKLDCRDIVWLREQDGTDGRTIPDSSVLAAMRALWVSDKGSRQSISVLHGLAHPHRDSIACRLEFDQEVWARFATALSQITLTSFLGDEPNPADKLSAMCWPKEAKVPSRTATTAPHSTHPPAFPRPTALPADLAPGAFAKFFRRMQEQIRKGHDVRLNGYQTEIDNRLGPALDAAATDLVRKEVDELYGLRRIYRWGGFLRENLRDWSEISAGSPQDFAPAWLEVTNELLATIPELAGAPFDLRAPVRWKDQLAATLPRVAGFLTPPTETPAGVEYCAAVMVSEILPRLLRENAQRGNLWNDVSAPLVRAITAHDAALDALKTECNEALAAIDVLYPLPTGLVSRLIFALFRAPRHRRLRHECETKFAARAEALCVSADRVFALAERWLQLATHQQMVVQLEAAELAFVERWLEPIERLNAAFVAKRASAQKEVDAIPTEPRETEDTLSFCGKELLYSLSADINLGRDDWLAHARQTVTKASPAWLTVAQHCEATLAEWAHTQVRQTPMNLSRLISTRLPDYAEERIRQLATLVQRRLLPLRPANASQRRLHQEWILPAGLGEAKKPLFEQTLITNDTHSTAPTSCVLTLGTDPDRLDLQVHLLGFEPADYLHWRLLPGNLIDAAS